MTVTTKPAASAIPDKPFGRLLRTSAAGGLVPELRCRLPARHQTLRPSVAREMGKANRQPTLDFSSPVMQFQGGGFV